MQSIRQEREQARRAGSRQQARRVQGRRTNRKGRGVCSGKHKRAERSGRETTEEMALSGLEAWSDAPDFAPWVDDLVLGVAADVVTLFLIFYCYLCSRNQVADAHLRYSSVKCPLWLSCIAIAAVGVSLLQLFRAPESPPQFKVYLASFISTWLCCSWLLQLHYVRVVWSGRLLALWWIVRPILNFPRLRTEFLKVGWSANFVELVMLSILSIILGVACLMDRAHRKHGASTDEEEAVVVEPLLQNSQNEQEDVTRLLRPTLGSWWTFWTFSWVTPLMNLGLQRQLSDDDLFTLPRDLTPSACSQRLWKRWEEEQSRCDRGPSLFRAVYLAYGWDYLKIGFLKAANDILAFSGPLLLNVIVKYLESGSEHGLRFGYFCAVGLGAVSATRAVLGTQYSFFATKIRLQLRAGITSVVYRKALCISLAERSCFSTGEIQTLMSIDADRVVNMCSSIHDLWSLPVQMVVALFLLYTQVKFAFVAGLAVVVLLIPVNRWIAVSISSASSQMMKQKDERVRRIGELLMYIRTLKMYTWEPFFTQRVLKTRKQEFNYLSTCKYLDAFCVYFWACTPTLFSLFTFGLFVILGHSLDAATVFTSIALFNILLSPLNSFPWVINGIIEARISLVRLHRFLSCPELDIWGARDVSDTKGGRRIKGACPHGDDSLKNDTSLSNQPVVIQDAHFSWSDSSQPQSTSTLRQICLTVQGGSLVVVLGEVGAGKSSLLEAILGEMRCVKGSVTLRGSAAFVSQTPWIKSGTLRENIIFGSLYNPERYQRVLSACALNVDVKRMQGEDLAEIGERGLNLSGGQKARLALARAVYQNCDIYLLDDPLSAVDAHVASWLMQKVIGGPLLAGKTRILCTYNSQALSMADMVVVMDKGQIKYVGKPHGLISSSFNLEVHEEGSSRDNQQGLEPPAPELVTRDCDTKPRALPTLQSYSAVDSPKISDQGTSFLKESSTVAGDGSLSHNEDALPLVEAEARNEGHVQAVVYRTYACFVGWAVVAVIFLSTALMQGSRNTGDWWLAYWVDSTLDDPDAKTVSFYLEVMLFLAVANTIFTFVRAFSFAYGGLRAAYLVHEALLEHMVAAPVSFFDRNPRGRILNRFSSDQYTVDDSLPFFVNILLAKWFNLFGITVILCLVQWIFLAVLAPLSYIYYIIQRYYRATSRELRRLDSVSRSPIYSSFVEALDGAPVIRSLKAQAQFCNANMEHIALNQRASFSEMAASLWLAVRIQMLAAFVVFFIGIMAIVSRQSNSHMTTATAGLVGLGLSYASPIITILSELLTSFTETEKEMISIERLQQYMSVDAEPDTWSTIVGPHWPATGNIEFEQVTLSYFPWLPPALDDLSFCIAAGEKIGIAGRTGAGKSSILNALFRLTPLSSGRIVIDGVSICTISLRRLRSGLSIVPQTPFLFEGTIRENLDPMARRSDTELWDVVEKCHMKDAVSAAGGLDLCVTESGENLSLGQCQLLCLARALLARARILCLDECTANVDPHTTSLLKETVAAECKAMTVVTIAHRISTISDLDRVLIMEHGKLVEDGTPEVLLADPSSKFYGFARSEASASLS